MKGLNHFLLSDSYKASHWSQLPPEIQRLYSYYESRGAGTGFYDILYFGLQYHLLKHYSSPVTHEDVEKATKRFALHFGDDSIFNRNGWLHVVEAHGGLPPVRIKAVPEGTLVPVSNVLMTIENTCDQCYWVTNWMETVLCMQWAPCTVATNSFNIRKLCMDYLRRTGDSNLISSRVTDFGMRGCSSLESAALCGAAHLISFESSDNQAAIDLANEYYDCEMAAYSIPASEHSTITSWGKDGELDAYRNMIKVFGKGKMFACVIDSYDTIRAVRDYWGTELHDEVLNMNATVVLRPDSGIPSEIVLKVVEILGEKFGSHVNRKGYRVLNDKVRVIQGDKVSYSEIGKIYRVLCDENRWSADNIAFGSGGALLQKFDRDSQEFAFKASDATIAGVHRDVYKDPVTDSKKVSKRGRLSLVNHFGQLKTEKDSDRHGDQLVLIYENGKLLKRYSLEEIRRTSIGFLA